MTTYTDDAGELKMGLFVASGMAFHRNVNGILKKRYRA
jgi:hypothetical protein